VIEVPFMEIMDERSIDQYVLSEYLAYQILNLITDDFSKSVNNAKKVVEKLTKNCT